ncbi:UNVERIFIED_CONTAM: hypothetical protein GTU68_000431 [Idotea baltica]|nr:hypothetical protein [Idotea baltica]
MAQIHALLLLSPESMTTEEIMESLQISRGNANMNTRALIDWGIVYKTHKTGERKEFFLADKDIWRIATQVAKERRKRELTPVLRMLSELKNLEPEQSAAFDQFLSVTDELEGFAKLADSMLGRMEKGDANWIMQTLLKLSK